MMFSWFVTRSLAIGRWYALQSLLRLILLSRTSMAHITLGLSEKFWILTGDLLAMASIKYEYANPAPRPAIQATVSSKFIPRLRRIMRLKSSEYQACQETSRSVRP